MPLGLRRIIVAALATLGVTGCAKRELLPLNDETFRTVAARRAAYAKSCPGGHVDFAEYFESRMVHDVPLRTVTVGQITAKTGQLVIADPFYYPAEFTHPFRRSVPPGRYPLLAVVADLGDWNERIAFTCVRLSDAPVARWEIAETTDPTALNEFFGVDAGLAAFSDLPIAEGFAETLTRFERDHPDENYYDDVLVHDLPPDANWCNHHPDGSKIGIPIVSSGLGDGLYSSYWGLDVAGHPAQLVTDFQLFDSSGPIMRK